MVVQARCHCGDTRITLPAHPTTAGRCNCTFCQRTGAVWGYYNAGELSIDQDASRRDYGTDRQHGVHHFCGTCGMHTWGESADWSQDGQGDKTDPTTPPRYPKQQVNLNLIDDLDWSRITIEEMDGRNQW